jgi:multisubunit Na+/H+ antiporter MnhB subunit
MVYISSIWTIVAWYNNNRTVEIFVKNNYNEYNKKTVTNLDSFYVLSYDVIFEIGIAYMFFYNLCTPLNIYGE